MPGELPLRARRASPARITPEAREHEWCRARDFVWRWYEPSGPIRITAAMGFGPQGEQVAPQLRRMTMVGVAVQGVDGTELQPLVPTDQARLRYDKDLQTLSQQLLIGHWVVLLAEVEDRTNPFRDQ